MKVAQASGCAPTLLPGGWRVLGCATAPAAAPATRRVGSGLQHPHSTSIHCKSSPTKGARVGIYSHKAASWEQGFWFGHLSSAVVVLQSAVLWVWHWALLSQGHRRLMVLLLLMPDDCPDDVKGNCQDFASYFPRHGVINDEECCTYCKFRLMLIWQLPSQGCLLFL